METLIFIGKAVGIAMVVITGSVFYMLCRNSGAESDYEECQNFCMDCRAYSGCNREIKVAK